MKTGAKLLAVRDETDVLDAALTGLRAMGLQTDLLAGQGQGRVRLRYGNEVITRVVEVRRAVTPVNLGVVAHQLAQLTEQPLLVTEYVTPPMAERLRVLGLQFVDAAGNAYIQELPLLVWVVGRRPEEKLRAGRGTRAFQTGGLKVVFALLCWPELADAPYRDIAGAAGVALGTVGWVLRDIKEAGFLLDIGKRRRKLVNRRRLLDQWVEAYTRQLRPRLPLRRFRASGNDWWKGANATPLDGVYWGGETAAAMLTAYLKPAVATVYFRDAEALTELLTKFRLKNDPKGDVEIRPAFWHFEVTEHPGLVPPLLVYADLLATGDDRNIDTARMIYDEHLARLVEPA
jgi:Uncharacterized protein conserved in bacteria